MDYIEALIEWIKHIFKESIEFFTDLPLMILDAVLSAVAILIEAVPVPDFMASGLQPLFDTMPDGVAYFAAESGIAQALLIVSAGVGFRLLRKALTLFQW